MLLSVHFPCADARGFLPQLGGRLRRPQWDLPDPNNDFVRHFGPLRIRVKGGSKLFVGESTVCRADGALRFPSWRESQLRCVFRGFYADGSALAKFDVGVAGVRERRPSEKTRKAEEIVRRVAELAVTVPLADTHARSRLGQVGPQLARAYLRASTSAKLSGVVADWSVRGGSPVITVLHGRRDRLLLPTDATVIPASAEHRGLELAHWWLHFAGTQRRVFSIGYGYDYGDVADYAFARQLRIDLVRLHCEREALRLVLTMVSTGQLAPAPRSPESDALQTYLNTAIARVTKIDRDRQHLLAELVIAAQDDRAAKDLEAMRMVLDTELRKLDIRPNIRRKTGTFVAGSDLEVPRAELDARTLKRMIAEQLGLVDYIALCAELADQLEEHGVEGNARADAIGGDGVEERAARLVEFLRKRGAFDYLIKALEARGVLH